MGEQDQEERTQQAAPHGAELSELGVEYLAWMFAGTEELFAVVGMPARGYIPRVIE